MSVSQESQNSLKRDHDSFAIDNLGNLEKPFTVNSQFMRTCKSRPRDVEEQESSIPTPPVSAEATKRAVSPTQSRRSSTTSLTDAGSVTPSLRDGSPIPNSSAPTEASPSKSAFTAMHGTSAPPPKRAKLTFAEKEAKRIEKEFRDQERAAEKAKKDAERQAHAEEKARKDAEKEAERKKKEAEKEEKRLAQEAEKAAKEKRKRKKEEEKRQKEEEKQRAEEEKKKKERSQKTLGSFFSIPPTAASKISVSGRSSMSPAPSNPTLEVAAASPRASTPGKEVPTYDKLFPAFFVRDNVTMAPINRFERDEEATEALEKLIDSYILGNRSPGNQRAFDPVSLFHLSGRDNIPRGKVYMSVREIMAELSGNASKPIDLTSDSQNTQIKRTSDLLKKIPLKFLHFQEDVRPPYRGTYTKRPINGIARLARNPLRRDLPDTNYDYDSEAEWVEDEDGEDLISGGEEEEEGGEEADDMDGFLDDSAEDTAQSRRMLLQGELEHTSTGLCWEDRHKKSTNVKMMPYRMEVIIGKSLPCSMIRRNGN
jgi:chromatin assembly factor 1 subunit A